MKSADFCFTTRITYALAIGTLWNDGVRKDNTPEPEFQERCEKLSAVIGEVIEHFPSAKLEVNDAKEPTSFSIECAGGFVLSAESTAEYAWFAAHKDWTPGYALDPQ